MLGVCAWGCPPMHPIQSFRSSTAISRKFGGAPVLLVPFLFAVLQWEKSSTKIIAIMEGNKMFRIVQKYKE
jgi:hypothetical protein